MEFVQNNSATEYRLPDNATLQHAVRLSITHDKPIMLDYWKSSLEKKPEKRAVIGVKKQKDQEDERLLVKSEEEYTSPISKIFKAGNEYIIMTENSIYLVDINIPIRLISP